MIRGLQSWLGILLLISGCAAIRATTVGISGLITQDTQDSGVSAVNNPGLNAVLDGDPFNVSLDFSGAITGPGMYTPSSILFSDLTAGASESAFISGSVTITQSAADDVFSALGCLIDAIACTQGNELDLNFEIPASQLNLANVSADPVAGLLSFDLLEDGGSTDIHGSVSSYSYLDSPASPAPEPATLTELMFVLLAGLTLRFLRRTITHR